MNNNIFSDKKKNRKIALSIIAIVAVIITICNMKLQSVSDYKAQQQSMEDDYNKDMLSQTGGTTTNPNFTEVGTQEVNDETIESIELSTADSTENISAASDEGQTTYNDNLVKNSTIIDTSSDNGDDSGNIAGNSDVTISNNDSKESTSTPSSEIKYVTCTIEIRCDTVLNNMSKWTNKKPSSIIPLNGIILDKMSISIKSGSTVYDVLMMATTIKNIKVVSQPNYIISINQLEQFDVGSSSGWMYWVNGSQPPYGCSGYPIEDGDKIKWQFTCNKEPEFDENGELK